MVVIRILLLLALAFIVAWIAAYIEAAPTRALLRKYRKWDKEGWPVDYGDDE